MSDMQADIEIVRGAIGPNPAFFKQILREDEKIVLHHVQGMKEDQLKALDRLRAGNDSAKDQAEQAFAKLSGG